MQYLYDIILISLFKRYLFGLSAALSGGYQADNTFMVSGVFNPRQFCMVAMVDRAL